MRDIPVACQNASVSGCDGLAGTMLIVSMPATEPLTAPTRPAGPLLRQLRSHGRLLAVAAGVGVVAVLAGLALRWWTHPDVFGEAGGAGDFVADPRPVSQAQMTFAVVVPRLSSSPATVTFRSAPVMTFATNTAQAEITFGICHPSHVRIADVFGSGDRYCSEIDPIVAGTTFHFRPGGPYIIATSTPTTPGVVVMTGADFDYATDRSHWYRRGVDHVAFRDVQRITDAAG
jgi:hypothetical protein